MANPLKMLKLKPTAFQLLQEVPINASPAKVWKSLLNTGAWFGMEHERGTCKIEPEIGGRFMSRTPDGSEARLFGFVAHIEPEKLLRINGPMGMTHLPVQTSMIWQLEPTSGGKATRLRFCHRAYGLMTANVKKQYHNGWKMFLGQLKALAEKRGK